MGKIKSNFFSGSTSNWKAVMRCCLMCLWCRLASSKKGQISVPIKAQHYQPLKMFLQLFFSSFSLGIMFGHKKRKLSKWSPPTPFLSPSEEFPSETEALLFLPLLGVFCFLKEIKNFRRFITYERKIR